MASSHCQKNYLKKHAYFVLFELLEYGGVNWLLGALDTKKKLLMLIAKTVYIMFKQLTLNS